MEKDLKKLVESLSRDELEAVAYATLSELIQTDAVRYNPDNSYMNLPYWEDNGNSVGNIKVRG